MRLCSILGQLIRHATVIQPDLAKSEISKSLCEACLKQKEMVKRRAVAALGEYLFYAATQLDEDNLDAKYWEIKEEAVGTIYKQLGIECDEITKHYAVKTIENITAQSVTAGILFATLDIGKL